MPDITFASEAITIRIASDVVEFLKRQRQWLWFQNERAGQLFGHIDGTTVSISEATGPRRGDRANHVSYHIDPKAAQAEINERYSRGLHFIGDWHTHPQREPMPSKDDLKSMRALFKCSKHDLNGMLMLIVGFDESNYWWCSLHGKNGTVEMEFAPPGTAHQAPANT